MSGEMQTVRVELGARAYDVHIGRGLLERAPALLAPVLRERRIFVVSDETVAAAHWPRLERALGQAGIAATLVVLPPGERTKDFAHLELLLDRILDRQPERRSLLLALGGGVIGDLVGLAASLLLRGVDFVQVPTTLLAQVDSSVGGKTAIDTRHGKNLVGSFHQPRLVLADLDALATLPARERRAGYAEIVKYGLIDEPAFFDWLERNGAGVVDGDEAAQAHAVAQSVRAKARIVAADEREGGARALLNLGHTFGHAIETAQGFGGLLHGEAVGVGMVLAFDLSVRLGLCPAEDAARLRRHLGALGMAVAPPPGLDPRRLVALMGHDKKVQDGRITFILARGIGRAFVTADVPADAVLDLLGAALAA
ncbi:MAG: 3-dehydroquinate synthase [Alphaproteobacteria bacterium]|nr:3-dehydroquinate synthase [Alphaproteobacteria bacterium]